MTVLNEGRWSRECIGHAVNDPASASHILGVMGSGEIVFGLDFDPETGQYSVQYSTKVDATVRGRYVVVVDRGDNRVEVWARDFGFQPKTLLFTQNSRVLDRMRDVFTKKDVDTRLLCGVVAEAQTVWANHMQEEIEALEAGDVHHED